MKLNLRALEGFRETMLTGSATAAAARMGLSQPAVSRLIAQVEEDFGFELFYRDKGRLTPTPEALMLYEEVGSTFASIDRITNLARDISSYNTGLLKVVAPPSLSEGVVSELLTRFVALYPKVRISIDSRSAETAKALVASRNVDCGFAKLPLNRPDLAAELLSSTETVCALRREHPLAKYEVLTPELLRTESLILLGLGSYTRMQIDDAFKAAGVRPNVKIETHTVASACSFASRGLGVAIVNEMMARTFPSPDMVLRVFRPQILHPYVFITSSLAPMNRLARALLDVALDYFAEAPPAS